ncbi:MAG: bifunctional [glutamine synthetase] adenylyltransferase/[glutamine synthetase]-adenylyl-L-tyrosine phosphorylase [Caulobacterales bacterium]
MKIAPPLIADEATAQRVREELELDALIVDAHTAALADCAAAAFSASGHLLRLARQRPETLKTILQDGPEAALQQTLAAAVKAAHAPDMESLQRDLRHAKADLHLCVGLGDLAGIFDLDAATGALSDFADACVRSAIAALARFEGVSGDPSRGPAPGYFLLSMGKMGAHELNYSSDIDLVAFFDPEALGSVTDEPQKLATRLTQDLVRALETRTEHGYVFRTDLRLRPDPGATPPAVSIDAAEAYYESFGQNWERAAFIKARFCAGDAQAAANFQTALDAFVWRKNLDFAAIADIHSIKRQLHAHRKLGGLSETDPDLKLGRGGIREIEFFAQTQQLILGGRVPYLRQKRTADALDALVQREALEPAARDELLECYRALRMVEHRIQMIDDEQTHRVPKHDQNRLILARFCGFEALAEFDSELRAVRVKVAERYDSLFAQEQSLSDDVGSLVFTGVDDDPDTLLTLKEMGFSNSSRTAGIIRDWHRGHVRAMRSARAREILTRLMPALLRGMADTGEPDTAFARFHDFLAALPAGVQVLSLLEQQPALLRGLLAALALSPLLAETLGRKPAILDSMFEPTFAAPIASETIDDRRARLKTAAANTSSFEDALNLVRRWRREEAFRIGFQTLTGAASAEASGAAYADIADCCVQLVADEALKEVGRRHGPPPGRWAVFGLGKLGGRELAEGSDLDIMVIYDPAPADEASTDKNKIDPVEYFARATQRLIAGLSAPTEEGALYDVDMNLRPSGRAGPVAVRLSAFKTYYEKDAWTWELMALTRLRFAAGDESLAAQVHVIARAVLERLRDAQTLAKDVAEMRVRVAKEKGDDGAWDLKLAPGGILDLEFLAQFLTLKFAAADGAHPNTGDAFRALSHSARLTQDEAHALEKASHLLLRLTYVLRLAYAGKFEPDSAAIGLKRLLVRAGETTDFMTLEDHLLALRRFVRAALLKHLGSAATEAGLHPV